MRLHPTVVIGLGSTGKYVIANVERYLYEVLNAEQLGLFKFVVLETAPASASEAVSSPVSATNPVDIKPRDLGAAWRGMKAALGSDFDWCPERLNIGNNQPGAGNMRAGGRLMLIANMDKIYKVISEAVQDVQAQAQQIQVQDQLGRLLQARGMPPMQNEIAPELSFLVVGTLAGGTCSGACVDLAYLLARIQPNASREAVFTFADGNAIPTYKENCWAALEDILFFTENRTHYRVSWLSDAQNPQEFSTSEVPEPPYQHVYLVSQNDMRGGKGLPYAASPTSPLLKMLGLFVTSNLLGLHDLRQTRLVDLNTRVQNNQIHEVLLTLSMRGVSYPKYEISEAAACLAISNQVCEAWLSSDTHVVDGATQPLQQETIQRRGREIWNRIAPPIWEGLRDSVDIPVLTRRIVDDKIDNVPAELVRLFSEQGPGTIYSQVVQNVSARVTAFQQALRREFAGVMQEAQSCQFGRWLVAGIASELTRTTRYWENLGVPRGDQAAWRSLVKGLVHDLDERMSRSGVNVLQEKRALVADELGEILARLEMFVMYRGMDQLRRWLSDDLEVRLDNAAKALNDAKSIAEGRAVAIQQELREHRGPLLRVSRSKDRSFDEEIEELSRSPHTLSGSTFVELIDDDLEGLLPLKTQVASGVEYALFNALRDALQPGLMQALQRGGPIDVVKEINSQGFTGPTIQRAQATQGLSIATTVPLMTGPDNVPAFVLAKSQASANDLMTLMRQSQLDLPHLSSEALPLLDHMVLFYQEGGRLEGDYLRDAQSFKKAFEAARERNPEIVDPLRLLKREAGRAAADV